MRYKGYSWTKLILERLPAFYIQATSHWCPRLLPDRTRPSSRSGSSSEMGWEPAEHECLRRHAFAPKLPVSYRPNWPRSNLCAATRCCIRESSARLALASRQSVKSRTDSDANSRSSHNASAAISRSAKRRRPGWADFAGREPLPAAAADHYQALGGHDGDRDQVQQVQATSWLWKSCYAPAAGGPCKAVSPHGWLG